MLQLVRNPRVNELIMMKTSREKAGGKREYRRVIVHSEPRGSIRERLRIHTHELFEFIHLIRIFTIVQTPDLGDLVVARLFAFSRPFRW